MLYAFRVRAGREIGGHAKHKAVNALASRVWPLVLNVWSSTPQLHASTPSEKNSALRAAAGQAPLGTLEKNCAPFGKRIAIAPGCRVENGVSAAFSNSGHTSAKRSGGRAAVGG